MNLLPNVKTMNRKSGAYATPLTKHAAIVDRVHHQSFHTIIHDFTVLLLTFVNTIFS